MAAVRHTFSDSAQKTRLNQIQSNYQAEWQKELADVRARIAQLQPMLDKSLYKQGPTELKALQDGIVKDLATTTVAAVVQPGGVVMIIVPIGEAWYADVAVKNEAAGLMHVGQSAQVKLSADRFQRHGMLIGKTVRISADATEAPQGASNAAPVQSLSSYKARIKLDRQVLNDAHGNALAIASGMQVVAGIKQGRGTVLECLLSQVRETIQEAGRERESIPANVLYRFL